MRNEHRVLLICVHEPSLEKAGMVRFDVDGEESTISINLAPSMRGKGLAVACLCAARSHFVCQRESVKKIIAQVRNINPASQHSFIGAGFTLVDRSDEVWRYEWLVG